MILKVFIAPKAVILGQLHPQGQGLGRTRPSNEPEENRSRSEPVHPNLSINPKR